MKKNITELEIEKGDEYYRLSKINNIFRRLFAEVIQSFEIHINRSETYLKFANLLHQINPTIITFNYDCIIESALEFTSGMNPILFPDIRGYDKYKQAVEDSFKGKTIKLLPDEIGHHWYNWDRRLSYGIEFDEITINEPVFITMEGKDCYNNPKNTMYKKSILKLHGSLNWFTYLPFKQERIGKYTPIELGNKENKVLLKDDSHHGAGFFDYRDNDGYFISPLIITPTLYKEKYYNHRIFEQLWYKAKCELKECDELVIIGYSFPHTDKKNMQFA